MLNWSFFHILWSVFSNLWEQFAFLLLCALNMLQRMSSTCLAHLHYWLITCWAWLYHQTGSILNRSSSKKCSTGTKGHLGGSAAAFEVYSEPSWATLWATSRRLNWACRAAIWIENEPSSWAFKQSADLVSCDKDRPKPGATWFLL